MSKLKEFKYECYDYSGIIPPDIKLCYPNFDKDYVIKNAEQIDDVLYITFYTPIDEVVVTINMKDIIEQSYD